jgi:hypothetical protein
VAYVPPHVLVVVARQRRAWEGRRSAHGGHANVDTTLNVYTQVLNGSMRDAVKKVGGALFTIVHKSDDAAVAMAG